MVNSPALRGMNGYSKVLLPEVPPVLLSVFSETFVSYTSKSGGKLTFGSSSRATLPRPETVRMRDAASCVLSSSDVKRADIPKLPTPPPNEAGCPAGSGLTLTLSEGVVILLRMVLYSSWKKLSKTLLEEPEPTLTLTRQTSSAGSMVMVPAC